MDTVRACEVCGSTELKPVLDLGLHPLCDDLVPIGSDRKCKEYPIEVLFCSNCNTAHQRFPVPKMELFKESYHYRARMTGSVLVGMADLVESCEREFGSLTGKSALDIGCNDGSLLDFFQVKGCKTIGVEPTGAAADSKHRTLNAFFERETAMQILSEVGTPDFITFTNVFAHIEHLQDLLGNLKLLLSEKTVLIIENHYLGDILKRSQFDTFYHEHPRTYSFRSFEFIAKTLGLKILAAEFVSRYGGNIRVFLGNGDSAKVTVDEKDFDCQIENLDRDLRRWRVDAKAMIDRLVGENGRLRAKAFPGRAAILIKLLDLNEDHLSAVYEIKGSKKVGHYVPGTRIPILPEADLFRLDKTKPILNLAWHIPAEVRANLEGHGYVGRVYDIKST